MTLVVKVILCAALHGPCCVAQTGTVTFYSKSISAKSEAAVFLPKSEQAFGGWLSDGPGRLALIQHGRFASFRLNEGPHTFTVQGPTGAGKESLVLNLKDGGQYCVRLYARMVNVGVYAKWDNKIEEITCQQAERDAAKLKPIDKKKVNPSAIKELDPQVSFPSFDQAQR